MKQSMDDASPSVSSLNDDIESLQSRLKEMEAILNQKDHQIDGFLNSKSWKLTQPLRMIAKNYRDSRNILKSGWKIFSWTLSNRKKIPFYVLRTRSILENEGIVSLVRKIRKKVDHASETTFSYEDWIANNDFISQDDKKEIQKRIEILATKPCISVIMPVFNPKKNYLIEAIDSVKNQIYQNWELCIADDASTAPYVKDILTQAADSDKRIKIVFRTKNGHISQASNSALDLATGDYVTFLDHDDMLAEHALYMVVEEINAHSSSELIYSDEDKIDEKGIRMDPHFKPDWNEDFFMSYNYLCHLTVIRKTIIQKIGGFRVGVEGAQDYDLILRSIQEIENHENIRHIPHILYHWRSHPGSTALTTNEKNYSHTAGLKALKDYWAAKDSRVVVKEGPYHCTYRVLHPIPSPSPLVSIIIPTKGKNDLLRRCIDSILTKSTYSPFEVLIVTNLSTDPKIFDYLEELEKNPLIRILRFNRDFNYSAVNNFAAEQANGSILLLLNDDTEVINKDWLEELVRQASRSDIGAVGAKLLYHDDKVQHAGFYLGIGEDTGGHGFRFLDKNDLGYCCRAQVTQNLSAVTGACLAVRRELYFAVGGLNPDLSVTCNDVDLCLKLLKNGYRNLWTPFVNLYHYELASRGRDDSQEKINRFKKETLYMKKEWGDLISNDPAYNPNLTCESENFSFAKITRAKTPWEKKSLAGKNQILNKGIKVSEKPIFDIPLNKIKILVIKLDHLGDMLTAVPALYRLREKFKDGEMDLVCGPWNVSLAEKMGFFRKIYTLNFFNDKSAEGISRKTEEEDTLVRGLDYYDIVIDLRSYPETRFLLSKIPATLKVGYRSFSKADDFLDICLDNPDNPNKHVSQKLLDLVNAIPYESFHFSGLRPFGERNLGCDEISVGIFPAAGSSARQWPLENFVDLVRMLSQKEPTWKIKVYIPPKEVHMGLSFDGISDHVQVLYGIPIEELISSVETCKVIVSNNSFGAHLPGYLGVDVVSVYSGVIPISEWRPAIGKQKIIYSEVSCSPCYLTHTYQCPNDMVCLKQISPDFVIKNIIDLEPVAKIKSGLYDKASDSFSYSPDIK